MISFPKKFLFIHIPKTGGNSIQNILKEYSHEQICYRHIYDRYFKRFFSKHINTFEVINPDDKKLHKHTPLKEYEHLYGLSKLNTLYKFATIRNPFDKLVSSFFSPHRARGGVLGTFQNLVGNKHTPYDMKNFESYIKAIKPIEYYIKDASGKTQIDYFIRFENLAHDFTIVCNKIGIEHKQLPHVNKSKRMSFQNYYSQELIDFIKEKHAFEIELGAYKF